MQNVPGPGVFKLVNVTTGSTIECNDTLVSGLAYQGSINPAVSFTTTRFGTYLGNTSKCKTVAANGLPELGVKITINGALNFNALTYSPSGGGVMHGRWVSPGTYGLQITLNYDDACGATIGGVGSSSGYHNTAFTNSTDSFSNTPASGGNLVIKTTNGLCDPLMLQVSDNVGIDSSWKLNKDLTFSP